MLIKVFKYFALQLSFLLIGCAFSDNSYTEKELNRNVDSGAVCYSCHRIYSKNVSSVMLIEFADSFPLFQGAMSRTRDSQFHYQVKDMTEEELRHLFEDLHRKKNFKKY